MVIRLKVMKGSFESLPESKGTRRRPQLSRRPGGASIRVLIVVYLTQGRGEGGHPGRQAGQTLEGLFSAASTPNFAIKASFQRSRRDLDNAHCSTDLRSQMFN